MSYFKKGFTTASASRPMARPQVVGRLLIREDASERGDNSKAAGFVDLSNIGVAMIERMRRGRHRAADYTIGAAGAAKRHAAGGHAGAGAGL